MGNFMETSLSAPVKWALSLSLKSPGGRLNTVFVMLFRCSKLSNDPVYVNQVIIFE